MAVCKPLILLGRNNFFVNYDKISGQLLLYGLGRKPSEQPGNRCYAVTWRRPVACDLAAISL
jgi:hypothetical protein